MREMYVFVHLFSLAVIAHAALATLKRMNQPKENKSALNRASMIESARLKFVSSVTPVIKWGL